MRRQELHSILRMALGVGIGIAFFALALLPGIYGLIGPFAFALLLLTIYIYKKTENPFKKGYDLNLISLDSVDSLPEEGKGLVTIAKIENFYHVRIFDWNGNRVIDKGEELFLLDEQLLWQLQSAFRSQAIDDQVKDELTQKITSSLGHTPVKKDKLVPLGGNEHILKESVLEV